MGRWVLCILSVLISVQQVWASEPVVQASSAAIDWSEDAMVPFRRSIEECGLYLTPAVDGKHILNDGVGVKFASAKIEEFRAELPRLIQEYGIDRMQGGRFYITGVVMGQEREAEAGLQGILQENGIQASVSALYVPRKEVVGGVLDFLDRARQRLAYLFPNKKLDFQKPIPSEVLNGLIVTAAIDTANVIYLFKSGMPVLDATATALTHVVLLSAYTVYSQYMLNWLLRDIGNQREFRIAQFKILNRTVDWKLTASVLKLKQYALSFPFVLNYTVFTQLTNMFENNPFAEITPVKAALSTMFFLVASYPTLRVQNEFYSRVITGEFGTRVGNQEGAERTEAARRWRPWFQAPILAADAVLLGWASTAMYKFLSVDQEVLGTHLGVNLNGGHVGIAALAVFGVTWFRLAPNSFDRALDKAIQLETWAAPFVDPIKERIYRAFPRLRPPARGGAVAAGGEGA